MSLSEASAEPAQARHVLVVGGGPAGLMAATVLAGAGAAVTVIERMPTVGRKLMMAGRGGLNLTHGEPVERFVSRYREAAAPLAPLIERFPPQSLVAFVHDLGEETFTGSSGRIFPKSFKASPLLRAWLGRLAALGVSIETGARWTGFDDAGRPLVAARDMPPAPRSCDALVLALGGGSWPRLGSDAAWTQILARQGIAIAPIEPSNMGVRVAWSEGFRSRFAGTPLKRIALHFGKESQRGEAMVTQDGLEGGAIYALSAPLRRAIAAQGAATLTIDLRPDLTAAALAGRLSRRKPGQSLSTWLGKAGLPPVAVAILREAMTPLPDAPEALAALAKAAPLRLVGIQPIDRAISSAGGVPFAALDQRLMVRAMPGVFVAGEMLDWEAPTGGYLLQACFASGVAAAEGALSWLADRR